MTFASFCAYFFWPCRRVGLLFDRLCAYFFAAFRDPLRCGRAFFGILFLWPSGSAEIGIEE